MDPSAVDRLGVALDLLLSGRAFLAEEAAELGLVKEVVQPEALMTRTLEYAEDIARHCSPASMAVIKRQAYGDATRDVDDATARAEALLHASLLRPDVIEGITSFFEKRAPNFPGWAHRSDQRGNSVRYRKDDHDELGLQAD
ncbi:enoyl-CoA hydratase [Mycobacterium xenopi 3993]|nr:enoyl-CoA hydratase [Mycobacterium xenopi 3993]